MSRKVLPLTKVELIQPIIYSLVKYNNRIAVSVGLPFYPKCISRCASDRIVSASFFQ